MASLTDLWSRLQRADAPPPFLLVDSAGLPGGARELPRDGLADLQCLFTGELADELADVAPYLGRLASVEGETPAVVADLLHRQVGILVLLAPGDEPGPSFQQVHRHFRKFNVVYGPDGKPLFFRYYDPRLLGQVLSVLEPPQVLAFFGPVERFVLHDGARALQLWQQGGKLVVEPMS